MDDCLACKTYRACRQDCTHFDYLQIRFCPYQIIWILQNASALRAGLWPFPPDDSAGSTEVNPEGYFVKATIAISEVEARLARTPSKGEILLTQIEDGRSLSNLSTGARAILMYVKGFRRREPSFSDWQKQKTYRRKMTTKA